MSNSAKGKKVFVGLSGGVDSAVSAALLQKEGYDVTGVFVRIALKGYPCSAGEDRREALRVAAHLQMPFLDIDLSKAYEEKIFRRSMDAYRRGETPNPDALCNREIKFGLLYDFAMSRGADFLATGHYARTSRAELLAGKDPSKDQSYFLWAVPEERLAKVIFPAGGLHKSEVRKLAKRFALPNAERKDSQGLCFLGGVSMEEALMKELAPVPGDVIDSTGAIIGRHRGAALYTVGERHGFDVRAKNAHAEPLYVVAKDAGSNTLTVASAEALLTRGADAPDRRPRIVLREENWIGEAQNGEYRARFRYRQKLFPARLVRTDAGSIVEIATSEPVPAGQSLVLYDADRCLGGGIVSHA